MLLCRPPMQIMAATEIIMVFETMFSMSLVRVALTSMLLEPSVFRYLHSVHDFVLFNHKSTP